MSSQTTSPAAVPPPSKAATQTRKFPLPCWTHDETVALIDAYRDRWISLRRGYLRTVDWEAVASTVASKCGHVVSPTKSSDQCRHKIEKLRQRYRAEKQRCVAAFPGKFVSGWIFFKGLSFLDDGGLAAAESKKRVMEEKVVADSVADVSSGDLDDGFFLTALGDRKFTIDLKNFVKIDEKIQSPNFGIRRNIPLPVENIPAAKFRKFARTEMQPSVLGQNRNFNGEEEFNFIRSAQMGLPVGYASRNMIFDVDEDKGFNFTGGVSRMLHSSMAKAKNLRNVHGNGNNSLDEDLEDGMKRDPLVEIAESIKHLGDGFLKMEKMRMEMALEFEKARMEMEWKRNEMIIESHKRMAEAFVNVIERKKSKK